MSLRPKFKGVPVRRSLRFESLESRRVLAAHPTAADNAYDTTEDATVTANFISDDTGDGIDQPEAAGGKLVAVAVDGQVLPPDGMLTLGSGATVAVQGDGSFAYQPFTSSTLNSLADGESSSDSFEYTVAAGFSSLYVFGDSLSDPGNLFTLTNGVFPPDPPYFQGRSSNGIVWEEYIRPRLNLSDTESFNSAIAGAETGRDNINDDRLGADLPGVLDQIDQFTGSLAGAADPDALYVLWAGANDFFAPFTDPAAAIAESVTNLVTGVGTLKAAGAQHVLVPNMANLGITPFAIATGQVAEFTALSVGFNQALAAGLAQAGLDVMEFDAFGFFTELQANAPSLGLTNVSTPCFDEVSICSDPETHAFWDSVHPTTFVHELLADAIFNELVTQSPLADTDVAEVTFSVQGVTTLPGLEIAAQSVAVPGQTVTLNLTASDSAEADANGLFQYTIDWDGDGNVDEQVQGPSAFSVTHVYLDEGLYEIQVTATDHDGDSSEPLSHELTVVTAAIVEGDLHIGGTERHDRIRFFERQPGRVAALVNGQVHGGFELSEGARIFAYGLDGRDYIHAGNVQFAVEFHGGNDRDHLRGSQLDDRLFGDEGIDLIFAGAGNDYLSGGNDRDIIFGDEGDDEIYGGEGNDLLFGQEGDDMIWGETGNDQLHGGSGNDSMWGGVGNDWLYGSWGDDLLDGGEDEDWLFGGFGNDELLNGERNKQ